MSRDNAHSIQKNRIKNYFLKLMCKRVLPIYKKSVNMGYIENLMRKR